LEEDYVNADVLIDGFRPEASPIEGYEVVRQGYGVTKVWKLDSSHDNKLVLDVLMVIDPGRYPTISRARKALRKGVILKFCTKSPGVGVGNEKNMEDIDGSVESQAIHEFSRGESGKEGHQEGFQEKLR